MKLRSGTITASNAKFDTTDVELPTEVILEIVLIAAEDAVSHLEPDISSGITIREVINLLKPAFSVALVNKACKQRVKELFEGERQELQDSHDKLLQEREARWGKITSRDLFFELMKGSAKQGAANNGRYVMLPSRIYTTLVALDKMKL